MKHSRSHSKANGDVARISKRNKSEKVFQKGKKDIDPAFKTENKTNTPKAVNQTFYASNKKHEFYI